MCRMSRQKKQLPKLQHVKGRYRGHGMGPDILGTRPGYDNAGLGALLWRACSKQEYPGDYHAEHRGALSGQSHLDSCRV